MAIYDQKLCVPNIQRYEILFARDERERKSVPARFRNAALLSIGFEFDIKSQLKVYCSFQKMTSNDSIKLSE